MCDGILCLVLCDIVIVLSGVFACKTAKLLAWFHGHSSRHQALKTKDTLKDSPHSQQFNLGSTVHVTVTIVWCTVISRKYKAIKYRSHSVIKNNHRLWSIIIFFKHLFINSHMFNKQMCFSPPKCSNGICDVVRQQNVITSRPTCDKSIVSRMIHLRK